MRLKKYIPIKAKRFILEKIQEKEFNKEKKDFIKYLNDINKNKIWILDACDHYNLGDQAILMAELEFLKDNFKDYQIISIGLNKYDKYIDDIRRFVRERDLIFLHGGGNLGNQYRNAERIRRDIIRLFNNNKIVLFPQTIYFSNDEEGREELQKSVEIYSKHKDLILVAREKISYKIMKEHFIKNKILLTPDIVLYLNKSDYETKRSGALFCCRNDMESILSQDDKKSLLDILNKEFNSVKITDTIGGNSFRAVEEKLEEFKNADLVVTDRIHGMVFAAITGTPCIALSNYNQKVRGTYEWIKELKYIRFVDSIDEIPKHIIELSKLGKLKYNNKYILEQYKQLINVV